MLKNLSLNHVVLGCFFLGSAAIENVGSHGKPPSTSRPDDASRNSRFRCAVALRGPRFLKQLLYEGAL